MIHERNTDQFTRTEIKTMRMELPPELPQRFDYPKMKDLHNQSSPATEQSYNWIQIFIEENQSKGATTSN